MVSIRPPAVAGSFYPGSPGELRELIGGFISDAESWLDSEGQSIAKALEKKRLRGIIVPHAGYVYSGPVAAYAYALVKRAKELPRKIIIIGPSHYAAFPGLAESGHDSWNTPLGDVEAFSIKDIKGAKGIPSYPAVHEPEHSLEVQIPFLQVALGGRGFSVDPILTGDLGPDEGADMIAGAVDDSFLVVSSDLSHYLPYKEAVVKDHQTLALLDGMDAIRFLNEGDACGRMGISIAIALAKRKGWAFQRLRYANSGDTAGPKSEVVGYGAIAIIGK